MLSALASAHSQAKVREAAGSTPADVSENGGAGLNGMSLSETVIVTSCELATLAQELILLNTTRSSHKNGAHLGPSGHDVTQTERLATVLPLIVAAGAMLQELRDPEAMQSPKPTGDVPPASPAYQPADPVLFVSPFFVPLPRIAVFVRMNTRRST